MLLKLHINKSVHDNASLYYQEAKETKKRIEGVHAAIEETKKEMLKSEKEFIAKKKIIKVKKEKKWFEKFHYFYTESGKLAVGGRNAQQNDIVYNKYFEEADLFFHSDIQGGTAIVLKDGLNASEDEQKEVAQFAASFSNAWKNANASVDVYSVKKEQVSKHSPGGFIPTGAFAIIGERKWFKSTKLGLKIGLDSGVPVILPEVSIKQITSAILLVPSKAGKEKGELTKTIAKRFAVHADSVMEILPNGRTKIVQ
ncbi:MAG: NFACT RNA binding domain-containing protein [Candidatus Micrarchaeota archaeon]